MTRVRIDRVMLPVDCGEGYKVVDTYSTSNHVVDALMQAVLELALGSEHQQGKKQALEEHYYYILL